MAEFLFVWELGAGLGHVSDQKRLATALADRGHSVTLAVRDVRAAETVLADTGIRYVAAPVGLAQPRRSYKPTKNYAQLLYNAGFFDAHGLLAQARAWRGLLSLVDPDVVVFDHSPVALLATRGLPLRRVLLGTSFYAPPPTFPLPGFESDGSADRARRIRDETRVLVNANEALGRLHTPPMDQLRELYQDVDLNLLTTFEELDHFGQRSGERYWGVDTSFSDRAPVWPPGRGKRVFAYLKRSPGLTKLLAVLQSSGAPTIVYGPWADETIQSKFRSQNVTIVKDPIDISRVSHECDIAILNATHGSTAQFLLAGKPILQVPLHMEQILTARNTARLGAGITVQRKGETSLKECLRRLMDFDEYRAMAGRFAEKYAAFDAERSREEMTALLEGLAT